jgi:hypothetical protein
VGSGTVDDHGSAVLEDPTGKRARWMRWAGRFVFVLFLAWLLAVVLGGLGLTPVVGLPFTHVLRPSQGPPALGKVQPRQPSASDLRPAVPAKVFAARAAQYGRRASAPGQTKTRPSSSVVRGRSATAPGHVKPTPSTTVRGRSTSAPGQIRTTSTSTRTTKKP